LAIAAPLMQSVEPRWPWRHWAATELTTAIFKDPSNHAGIFAGNSSGNLTGELPEGKGHNSYCFCHFFLGAFSTIVRVCLACADTDQEQSLNEFVRYWVWQASNNALDFKYNPSNIKSTTVVEESILLCESMAHHLKN